MYRGILYTSILLIAFAGIIYELIVATTASYLFGNSVYHFSITIGIYMSAMGAGAWISKYFSKNLLSIFIFIEVLISLFGGISAFIIYALYSYGLSQFAFFMITVLIGILVGTELPLLIRIVEEKLELKNSLAEAFSFDYFGALVGSIVFPLFLLPSQGIIKAAFLVGIINLLVVILNIIYFKRIIKLSNFVYFLTILVGIFLITGSFYSHQWELYFKNKIFADPIIYNVRTKYQDIVFSKWKNDLRMFINGGLQFSSIDEYRYHESLVHPAMSLLKHKENILILGGGDGLAVRELLKYHDIKKIYLVDIDREIIDFCSKYPPLVALNKGSLKNKKVKVIIDDAFNWLAEGKAPVIFDLIISDLPDPHTLDLNKLYSEEFFKLLKRYLSPQGIFVIQSSSPYFTPRSYWCIGKTLTAAGFKTIPYHVDVPSFGEWGFFMAHYPENKLEISQIKLKVKTRFLNNDFMSRLFAFPEDELFYKDKVKVNSLNFPIIMRYYEEGWKGY